MRPFWISWYATGAAFELHSPWWISGCRYVPDDTAEDGEREERMICAAVMARDEAHAGALILAAHDDAAVDLEWRFCTEKPAGWAPWVNPNGPSRFQRATWMVWP